MAAQQTETGALVKKVVEAMQRRGSMGFVQLQRTFRLADRDKSGCLSREEFVTACRKIGITLQERELSALGAFDANKDGKISYIEFLRAVRGPMNPTRTAVVRKAFDKLDRDGSGVVTVDDLRGRYAVRTHPDVVSGKKSEDEVLAEFLANFEGVETRDGKVTWEEFQDYYNDISVCIDDDRHFSLIIFQAWKL